MRDIPAFKHAIRDYYTAVARQDGRRYTQGDLADAIFLDRSELAKRLNARKGAILTETDGKSIVRTLAEWSAITTRDQARRLLALAGCPDLSDEDWRAKPFNALKEGSPQRDEESTTLLGANTGTGKTTSAPAPSLHTGTPAVAEEGSHDAFSGQVANTVQPAVSGADISGVGKIATQTSGRAAHHSAPFMTPPLPPQGVIGRDTVLNQIMDLLHVPDPETRDIPPLALRGMGGIGKTTLTLALGRHANIPYRFPDGVLWVALGPNPSVRLLLDGWGRALHVDVQAERDETACMERLRSALFARQALIIIDDVWNIAHGKYFLVGGPHCRTLLTTRESPIAYTLATPDRTLVVDVLEPDAALALLRSLAPQVVSADAATALRLCERLEYLPLALTLAGRLLAIEADVPARMRRIAAELVEKRESRLTLLQAEGRLGFAEDTPVSLHAILGMSVERLDQTDQARFAMLGVFGGEPLTWEINAVAAVWECSLETAEGTIARFIQRGLVEPRGQRFWMHALLNDYANEMMDNLGL